MSNVEVGSFVLIFGLPRLATTQKAIALVTHEITNPIPTPRKYSLSIYYTPL